MRIIYAVVGGLIIIFAGVKLLETPWHKHHAHEAVEKHLASSNVKFRNLKYFDPVCGEYASHTDPTRFHKFYWSPQAGLNIRDENKGVTMPPSRMKPHMLKACWRVGMKITRPANATGNR